MRASLLKAWGCARRRGREEAADPSACGLIKIMVAKASKSMVSLDAAPLSKTISVRLELPRNIDA
jgi:hypothetical protein